MIPYLRILLYCLTSFLAKKEKEDDEKEEESEEEEENDEDEDEGMDVFKDDDITKLRKKQEGLFVFFLCVRVPSASWRGSVLSVALEGAMV